MEDEGARTSDESAFNRSLALLAVHLAALGAPRPVYKPYSPKRFEDQARVLLDAKVPAFSFIYGIPPKEVLDECHHRGMAIIGTATTVDEAIALEEAGVDVDVIIATHKTIDLVFSTRVFKLKRAMQTHSRYSASSALLRHTEVTEVPDERPTPSPATDSHRSTPAGAPAASAQDHSRTPGDDRCQ